MLIMWVTGLFIISTLLPSSPLEIHNVFSCHLVYWFLNMFNLRVMMLMISMEHLLLAAYCWQFLLYFYFIHFWKKNIMIVKIIILEKIKSNNNKSILIRSVVAGFLHFFLMSSFSWLVFLTPLYSFLIQMLSPKST